jgi:membrane dipeptidase
LFPILRLLLAMDYPIFDGHNDTLTRIHKEQGTADERTFFKRSDIGAIDYPRAMEGGLTGGFFAIFIPNKKEDGWNPKSEAYTTDAGYNIALPPQISQAYAEEFTATIIDSLSAWETQAPDRLKMVRTIDELEQNIGSKTMSAILHFEGTEQLHPDLSNLQHYYDLGLRSLGPVWSRPNAFGHGVPFAFPASPDTGPGLTDAGKNLIRACNKLGILVDVSHLNEKGFWDIHEISNAPIVATHCGAHAMAQSTRNLTDEQLDAITASNGIIGVNFATNFLREDGDKTIPTSHEEIVRHLVYLVDRMGIDHVAFGSDFDGAQMPIDVSNCAQLPTLITSLKNAGFNRDELQKLTHKNWVRVLKQTWK